MLAVFGRYHAGLKKVLFQNLDKKSNVYLKFIYSRSWNQALYGYRDFVLSLVKRPHMLGWNSESLSSVGIFGNLSFLSPSFTLTVSQLLAGHLSGLDGSAPPSVRSVSIVCPCSLEGRCQAGVSRYQ